MSDLLTTLRTTVGLRGVDTTAPVWVNDLPGMSTELVANLAQSSDIFGEPAPSPEKAVWESVHRNASQKLQSEILLMLSENYDFEPIVMRTPEPQRSFPAEVLTGSGLFLGTLATIPYTPNAIVNLRSISVFVTPNAIPNYQAVPASVRVYDADTNAQFYAAPHEIEFGYNSIDLNLQFQTMFLQPLRLLVVIDSYGLYLTTLLTPTVNDGCSILLEGKRTVNTADLANSLQDEAIYMSLDIDVTRTLDKLLPRFVQNLQVAYQNLCGSLLMTEKLASPNLSVFTLSNVAFAEKMEQQLLNEFKRALKPVVRRLSNELLKKQALTVPVPTPDEPSIKYGSFV